MTSTATERRAPALALGRRRASVVAPAVLAPLAVVAAVWWGTSPRPEVPVPPPSATPEQVVRAYLAASTAHDVDTMNALVDGDGVRRASRFDATWTVRDVRTSPPVPDTWIGDENPAYAEVVHVDVDLHILKGHDLNFPDDTDRYWGYMLGRRSPTGPWRILEQGIL